MVAAGVALLAVLAVSLIALLIWDDENKKALNLPAGEIACGDVAIPAAAGVEVEAFPLPPHLANQEGVNFFLILRIDDPGIDKVDRSFITFNPGTGEVVAERFNSEADRAKLTGAFNARTAGPLTASAPAWPRTETSMNSEPEFIEIENVRIRNPEPGAGVLASLTTGDSGATALELSSCTSMVTIDVETGEVITADIDPNERDVFDRWLDDCQGCK